MYHVHSSQVMLVIASADVLTMRFDPQAGISRLVKTAPARRKQGRLEQESLVSSLGQVLDLSAGGMRVLTRKPPKGEIHIELRGLGDTITLVAQVAWSKKIGLLKYEVGLVFLNVTPERVQKLTNLAMNNRLRKLA